MKKENIILIIETIILFLIIGIYAAGIYYYYYYEENIDTQVIEMNDEPVTIECPVLEDNTIVDCPVIEKEENIFVELKGEVINPGVYEVTEKNIVKDVINLAGGLTKNAFTDNLNMSHRLLNEMVIYIYSNNQWEQIHKEPESQITIQNDCYCEELDISSCQENGQSIIVLPESVEPLEQSTQAEEPDSTNTNLVNINTASIDELKTLDGIGDAKAQKIIEYRQEKGLFSLPEDIMKVSGISENLYAKIKDYITV